MEEIDIEALNFDVYNREVYQGNNSKPEKSNSDFVDPQRKYKIEINKFVENYYKNLAAKNEKGEENLERKKKRKN